MTFTATLPDDPPTWVLDMEKSIRAGTMTGVSPGFRVPPLSKVPRAEELIPEPGNPAVSIRVVRAAVLREMSVVTNAMYEDAVVELRSEFFDLQPNAVLMLPSAADPMAVTLSQAELSAALRLSDTAAEIAEAELGYWPTQQRQSPRTPLMRPTWCTMRQSFDSLVIYLISPFASAWGCVRSTRSETRARRGCSLPYRVHRAGVA